jgi:hypothetical protein
MKVRLTKRAKTTDGWREPGHLIDHPDAHYLVALQLAEEVPDAPAAESVTGPANPHAPFRAADTPADVAPEPPPVAEAATDVELPEATDVELPEATDVDQL